MNAAARTDRNGGPPRTVGVVTVRPRADMADVATAEVAAALERPSFWLDSAPDPTSGPAGRPWTPGEPVPRDRPSGRYSFLGDAGGPHGEVLEYRVGQGLVVRERTGAGPPGEHREPGPILDVLATRLDATRSIEAALPTLPPPTRAALGPLGGYVGYLGYEAAADLGLPVGEHRSDVPDAVWLRATRYVAFDHHLGVAHVVTDPRDDTWTRRMTTLLTSGRAHRTTAATRSVPDLVAPAVLHDRGAPTPARPAGADCADPARVVRAGMRRGPDRYLEDVRTCLRALRRGDSWELCLTDTISATLGAGTDGETGQDGARVDDLDLYLRLRRANPAPYSALLRLGSPDESTDLTCVLCSSPERFLAVDRDGHVTTKPIKGTAPRHEDPTTDAAAARGLVGDPKSRAENVVVVDLVRNDLSRVCADVHVDPLLDVESYATVHQLVSTVHGRLRPGRTAVDAIRATFPPGSMTGAPKHRTVELLSRIEGAARGIYSGTIGYLAADGSAVLNVAIRTAVRRGDRLTVGAGGAIVLGSDPADELDEMVHKAVACLGGLTDGAAAPAGDAVRRAEPGGGHG